MTGATSYDPEARRDTPLARWLIKEIGTGSMPLDVYMHHCLYHEAHGYYATHAGIGADFVTAPEISQVFGELIGLWAIAVWQSMGSPQSVCLVEYGPGRGTLMRDALRAARLVPSFLAAAHVALEETSPTFEAIQRATLSDSAVPIAWRADLLAGQPEATIILANEFYDCLPVAQSVANDGNWYERHVAVEEDRLVYRLVPAGAQRAAALAPIGVAVEGTVVEHHNYGGVGALAGELAKRAPFALLAIDYGYEGQPTGDTLQAVRRHAYEHPLTSPGEADLTSHVPFATLADGFERASLAVDGPTTQAKFLGRLGIVQRAARLMQANPTRAGEIEAGVARLIAPQAMGTRFKVLGARSVALAPLPGF